MAAPTRIVNLNRMRTPYRTTARTLVIYVDNFVGTGSYHGDFFPVIAEDDDIGKALRRRSVTTNAYDSKGIISEGTVKFFGSGSLTTLSAV